MKINTYLHVRLWFFFSVLVFFPVTFFDHFWLRDSGPPRTHAHWDLELLVGVFSHPKSWLRVFCLAEFSLFVFLAARLSLNLRTWYWAIDEGLVLYYRFRGGS